MSQENVHQLNTGEQVPDGDLGGILVSVPVPTATSVVKIPHGLGRVPTKAYVVESVGQPFTCYTVYKDRDVIHLCFFRSATGFSPDGGTATVRIV